MKALLAKVVEKRKLKDFDGMLEIFRELESHNYLLPPRFAVLKSRAIQLTDDTYDYDLRDAELCLLEAIENDENYVPAHIDLGFYYYAVEDDSEKALGYFEQAINKSVSHLREAIIGKAKALADLDRHQEALACLNENVIAEADFGLTREELSS